MKIVQHAYGNEGNSRLRSGRAAGSPYLLTGLLRCSECDGSITIVSGKWNGRQDHRYGCSMYWYRGKVICGNMMLIPRQTLEKHLLRGLQERVLNPEVVEATLRSLEKQLVRAMNRQGDQSAEHQARVEIIQKQIRNCTDAICEGRRSHSLMEKLSELERELADAKAKRMDSKPKTFKSNFGTCGDLWRCA